jgi:ankyrin repeat protein
LSILIEKGANVNAVNTDGNTPLHMTAQKAILMQNLKLAELLIDKGANVNAVNTDGNTPLYYVASRPDRTEKNENRTLLAELLIKNGADVKALNGKNTTILHVAILMQNLKLAELLIDKGANVNAVNTDGNTPLHMAARNKNLKAVELLIDKGANVNAVNKDENTPLHVATRKKNLEVVKLLIGKDANVNAKDTAGTTPLNEAIKNNNIKLAVVLVNRGGSLDEKDELRFIIDALSEGYLSLVDWLVKGNKVSAKCQKYLEEYKWIKWLAGEISLAGEAKINDEKVVLNSGEGGYSSKLADLFNNFASLYQGETFKWLNSLPPLFQFLRSTESSRQILKGFQTNAILNLRTGSSDHAIYILYIENYLLIINRGAGAEPFASGNTRQMQSIVVKKIDRSRASLDETIINKLLEPAGEMEEQRVFFYDELPKKSGAIDDDSICNFFKSHSQKAQKVGNCWWVSPKSMILAIMAMDKFLKIPVESRTPEKMGEALKEVKNIYKAFSKFSKIHLFIDYLAKKIQEKKSSENLMIPPDFEFLKRIYTKLQRKYPGEEQLENSWQQFKQEFKEAFPNVVKGTTPYPAIQSFVTVLATKIEKKEHLDTNQFKDLQRHYQVLKNKYRSFLDEDSLDSVTKESVAKAIENLKSKWTEFCQTCGSKSNDHSTDPSL